MLQNIIPKQNGESLPLCENSDWIESTFSDWQNTIRLFREILLEKGWQYKVGIFETEIVIDLNQFNLTLFAETERSSADVLIGYKKGRAFLVYINLNFRNILRFKDALKMQDSIDYSYDLIRLIDEPIELYAQTIVLFDKKNFYIKERLLRNLNSDSLLFLKPMTVEDFYNQVFIAGYKNAYM